MLFTCDAVSSDAAAGVGCSKLLIMCSFRRSANGLDFAAAKAKDWCRFSLAWTAADSAAAMLVDVVAFEDSAEVSFGRMRGGDSPPGRGGGGGTDAAATCLRS